MSNPTEPAPLAALETMAAQGDAAAQYQLGTLYYTGEAVTRDYAAAAKWFSAAAEGQILEAQVRIAVMYSEGQGVPQDASEAVKWYKLAAEKENPEAQLRLGGCYLFGEGVAQDLNEGLRLHRVAANQNYLLAQCALAAFYCKHVNYGSGSKTITTKDYKDDKEAVRWLKAVAENDFSCDQSHFVYLLGDRYRNGEGVPKDESEAVKYFRMAAEKGNSYAEYAIGLAYSKGEGVPKDDEEAVRWFRKAAEQGDKDAQHNLGWMCAQGLGTPKDYVEAYMWYNLAATTREDARESRDNLGRMMAREQIAEAQKRSAAFVVDGSSGVGAARSEPDTDDTARGYATGFFISSDGFLLTAAHVVNDASSIEVRIKDRRVSARSVAKDLANDIAILKAEGHFPFVPVSSSRDVSAGDSVFTVGFPNPAIQGQAPKVTRGEVNSLSGIADDPRFFQTSVAVQPGNSGGALATDSGHIVGLVVGQLDERVALVATGALPQNVNYAVKSSYILPLLESVPDLAKSTSSGANPADPVKVVEAATVLVVIGE